MVVAVAVVVVGVVAVHVGFHSFYFRSNYILSAGP
jgi:hypothetical protein